MFGLNPWRIFFYFTLIRDRKLHCYSLKILKSFFLSPSISLFISSHDKQIKIYKNIREYSKFVIKRRLDAPKSRWNHWTRRKTIYRKSSTRGGDGFFANVMVLSGNFSVVQRKRNSLAGNFMILRAQCTSEDLCACLSATSAACECVSSRKMHQTVLSTAMQYEPTTNSMS